MLPDFQKNAQKLKKIVRRGQILPCEVVKILNDREVIIAIRSLALKAYTDLPFQEGDKAFLRIDQIEDQLRFKLLNDEEFSKSKGFGVDYTI